MRIAFYGDSLTEGIPGVAFLPILAGKFPDGACLDSAGAEIVAEVFISEMGKLF